MRLNLKTLWVSKRSGRVWQRRARDVIVIIAPQQLLANLIVRYAQFLEGRGQVFDIEYEKQALKIQDLTPSVHMTPSVHTPQGWEVSSNALI